MKTIQDILAKQSTNWTRDPGTENREPGTRGWGPGPGGPEDLDPRTQVTWDPGWTRAQGPGPGTQGRQQAATPTSV